MEKEVEINGKKYNLKEISYIKALTGDPNDKAGMAKLLFKECAGLTDDDIDKLSVTEGIALQNAINSLNYADFQNPTK